MHQSDADATEYTCALCGSEWVWAICSACDRLELALAGQESWRCDSCARYTRSWWRTPSARSEAIEVRRRRAAHRAAILEARLAGPRRKRRLILVAVGATLVLAAAVAAFVITVDRGGSEAEHTRIACTRFETFRSDLANGALRGDRLAAELATIREHAERGDVSLAVAARDLTPPAQPDSAAFLVAQTRFAQACAALSTG